MTGTAEQLNSSDWRKHWTLEGNILTHSSGIQFEIEEANGKVDIKTITQSFMEYQTNQLSKGKTQEEIVEFIQGIAPQIQAFYYEAKTGNKTSFAPLQ